MSTVHQHPRTAKVASFADTIRMLIEVILPPFAKGTIIRRPKIVGLVERLDLDARGVRRMQALRKKYGDGPLKMRVPVLHRALVMHPDDVAAVLDATPHPYTPASDEKRAALSQFEPENVLITRGPKRKVRRAFHESVLETEKRVHQFGDQFVNVAHEEADALLQQVRENKGVLEWPEFREAWYRVIRRVAFGDWARDDTTLTDMSDALRSVGNWSSLTPTRKEQRAEYLALMEEWISKAAPESLAGRIPHAPVTEDTNVPNQPPQWLFAFDPGGMVVMRALALLSTHPDAMAKARAEIAADTTGGTDLPFLRKVILDTLRLWPTTPLLLRQSMEETHWGGKVLPANTGMIIFEPYFHRDTERLEFADRFAPEIWDAESVVPEMALVPFSGGSGICPANNLVPMVTSAMLAAMITACDFTITSPQHKGISPDAPLPGTLDNFALRFHTTPKR